MIALRGVTVRVPVPGAAERTLLDAVTLDLTEHRVGVVGGNGSGKSTLLRLLNGLLLPSAGEVLVDGLSTRSQGSKVRRAVAFTFTDPLAQLVMSTPVEDVELSLRRIRDKGERRRVAADLLARRGLAGVATQSIYDLSGGERQLVALTSVLAVEPSILVCDEPTTLLDLRNRRQVIEALMAIDQQLVVATHDLDLARRMDRVLWIDGGRVHADGDPAEVIDAYVTSIEGA